ncbi:MAG: response regulator [Ectothiorhodospira sp.]
MDRFLGRRRVLVVDDFPAMRATLSQMLRSMGLEDEPDTAADAAQALARLRARRYDIVLCDYNLGGGMDGQQLLDIARREGRVDVACVFILITAENSSEMVMAALESGPDAYLSKPITKLLLRTRLERALKRRDPMRPVAEALARGEVSRALDLLALMRASDQGETADILRLQADLGIEAGDLAIAEQAALEALKDRPPAWACNALGRVAQLRGDLAAAETRFREAIAVTPYFMSAHDHLAAVLELQDRPDEALDVLDRAVQRSSRSLSRQRRLGRLALEQGHWDLSAQAWQRAIDLAVPQGEARPEDFVWTAFALARAGDPRGAHRCLNRMDADLEGQPELPWWSLIGRLDLCGVMAADPAELLDALDARLLWSPPPETARAALLQVLVRMGETERAELLGREAG